MSEPLIFKELDNPHERYKNQFWNGMIGDWKKIPATKYVPNLH